MRKIFFVSFSYEKPILGGLLKRTVFGNTEIDVGARLRYHDEVLDLEEKIEEHLKKTQGVKETEVHILFGCYLRQE